MSTTLFVLISLLAPSLRYTMRTANQIACMSNLKQLGLSFSHYAEDWNDFAPPGSQLNIGAQFYNETNVNVSWDDVLMDYLGYELSDSDKNKSTLKLASHPNYPQNLHCPADSVIEAQAGGIRRSYSMSRGKPDPSHINRGMGGRFWSTRFSDVQDPSLTALTIETDHHNNVVGKSRYSSFERQRHLDPTYEGAPNGQSETFGLHDPGSANYNYLFVDNHVSYLFLLDTIDPEGTIDGHNGVMTINPDDNPSL